MIFVLAKNALNSGNWICGNMIVILALANIRLPGLLEGHRFFGSSEYTQQEEISGFLVAGVISTKCERPRGGR